MTIRNIPKEKAELVKDDNYIFIVVISIYF